MPVATATPAQPSPLPNRSPPSLTREIKDLKCGRPERVDILNVTASLKMLDSLCKCVATAPDH